MGRSAPTSRPREFWLSALLRRAALELDLAKLDLGNVLAAKAARVERDALPVAAFVFGGEYEHSGIAQGAEIGLLHGGLELAHKVPFLSACHGDAGVGAFGAQAALAPEDQGLGEGHPGLDGFTH